MEIFSKKLTKILVVLGVWFWQVLLKFWLCYTGEECEERFVNIFWTDRDI